MGLRSTPLKSFFRCRSTRWWQSTQAKGTKDDPCNHTRWKHRWAWHNRGCVWDKIATDWACKTDWMSERKKNFALTDTTIIATFTLECVKVSGKKVDGGQSSTRVKKVPQCSCVGTEVAEKWINGQYSLGFKDRGKLAKFKKNAVVMVEKGKSTTLSRRMTTMSSTFFGTIIRKQITGPTWELWDRKIIIDRSGNTEEWKAAKGFWDGSSKHNDKSGCSVVIKGVHKDRWVMISKIAVPLIVGTAVAAEVLGACSRKSLICFSTSAGVFRISIGALTQFSTNNVVTILGSGRFESENVKCEKRRGKGRVRRSSSRAFGIRTSVICDLCRQCFPHSLSFPWWCKIAMTSREGQISQNP